MFVWTPEKERGRWGCWGSAVGGGAMLGGENITRKSPELHFCTPNTKVEEQTCKSCQGGLTYGAVDDGERPAMTYGSTGGGEREREKESKKMA